MTEDVVRALGFLCLGSRFKRIGERLQAHTARIVQAADIQVQPGQYTFMAAIDRLGPLTIGELTEAIGITQPGVTRNVAQLIELGMLEAQPSPEDQRRRIISLTAEGEAAVDFAKRNVWPLIEGAVADLCAGLSGPLLAQLAELEDGLDEKPLERRVAREAKP